MVGIRGYLTETYHKKIRMARETAARTARRPKKGEGHRRHCQSEKEPSRRGKAVRARADADARTDFLPQQKPQPLRASPRRASFRMSNTGSHDGPHGVRPHLRQSSRKIPPPSLWHPRETRPMYFHTSPTTRQNDYYPLLQTYF